MGTALNVLFTGSGGFRTLAPMQGRRTETEQWFIRRGLPHFIEPYGAGPDVWSRAAPVLLVAYVAGGLHALDLAGWTLARNLAAATAIVAILFATWVLTNHLRHRPALSRPRELGVPELAAFLVGPALPALVFEQWGDALQAVVEGAVVLLLIYVVTSYGLIPLMGWAAAQTWSRVASVGRMLTRALPLLLLFTTFLFINPEVWQVAGTLVGPIYVITLGLFFVLGSAFVLSRIPSTIRAVNVFDDWAEVGELVRGTPAEGLPLPTSGDPMDHPLSIRQRVNIGLVSLFSQAILITFVGVVLALFFTLFGLLAIPVETTASWTQLTDVHVLLHWDVGGRTLVLTEPLLRVAGFLGVFTGMYFTVVLSTDATFRDEFAEDAGPQIRQALAVRLASRHAARSE